MYLFILHVVGWRQQRQKLKFLQKAAEIEMNFSYPSTNINKLNLEFE